MFNPFIHTLVDVYSTGIGIGIGIGTRFLQFVVVLAGARIGQNCNLCSHGLVENDFVIGDRVTVKSGAQLWDGLRVGHDVFIGLSKVATRLGYVLTQQIGAGLGVAMQWHLSFDSAGMAG